MVAARNRHTLGSSTNVAAMTLWCDAAAEPFMWLMQVL